MDKKQKINKTEIIKNIALILICIFLIGALGSMIYKINISPRESNHPTTRISFDENGNAISYVEEGYSTNNEIETLKNINQTQGTLISVLAIMVGIFGVFFPMYTNKKSEEAIKESEELNTALKRSKEEYTELFVFLENRMEIDSDSQRINLKWESFIENFEKAAFENRSNLDNVIKCCDEIEWEIYKLIKAFLKKINELEKNNSNEYFVLKHLEVFNIYTKIVRYKDEKNLMGGYFRTAENLRIARNLLEKYYFKPSELSNIINLLNKIDMRKNNIENEINLIGILILKNMMEKECVENIANIDKLTDMHNRYPGVFWEEAELFQEKSIIANVVLSKYENYKNKRQEKVYIDNAIRIANKNGIDKKSDIYYYIRFLKSESLIKNEKLDDAKSVLEDLLNDNIVLNEDFNYMVIKSRVISLLNVLRINCKYREIIFYLNKMREKFGDALEYYKIEGIACFHLNDKNKARECFYLYKKSSYVDEEVNKYLAELENN